MTCLRTKKDYGTIILMLKSKGITSGLQFNLYWLAIALEKTKDFPGDINRWPVEILVEVNVEELKDIFSKLSKKVMDKIKE